MEVMGVTGASGGVPSPASPPVFGYSSFTATFTLSVTVTASSGLKLTGPGAPGGVAPPDG